MSNFYQLLSNAPEGEYIPEEQEEVQEQQEGAGPHATASNSFDYSFLESLPPGWKPEQKFASSEEELQFYREKYPGLWQHINSDDFLNGFLDSYGNQIASKEQEIQQATELIKALNADPESFIAAHLPEYAEKLGVGRIFNNEEIGDYIDSKIEEEFGENWRDVYNPADLVRRNSVSSQILKRSQQLEQQLEQHNETVKVNREKFLRELSSRQAPPQPGQLNPQQLDQVLDHMVDAYFDELADSGLSEDEFIELAINSFTHQPTMKDIYRVMHHDKIIEQERRKAYEEGRKSMVNEYKKGSKRAALDYVPHEDVKQDFKPKSFMGLRLGDGI